MIYNLGSINVDHVYEVPHLPTPGETLAAFQYRTGLGGKGANMSVAIARAGGDVCHIGAVGPDGGWARDRLRGFGVDDAYIVETNSVTGHAIINVDPSGENAIVIFPGANQVQSGEGIQKALAMTGPGDWLLLQNETNGQDTALKTATAKGMRRVYAAAPFDADAVKRALPMCDLLVLNEVEMAQLTAAMGADVAGLGGVSVVETRGAKEVRYYDVERDFHPVDIATPRVNAVDTTGAGDTFTGFLVAGLDAGLAPESAIQRAITAAAISVTRKGTTDAIPTLAEVEAARF